jgi:hypothetical protein
VNGQRLRQLAAWLAGVWTGLMAGVGFVAAPALFSTLAGADAGRVATRLFELDAYAGLGFGAALLVLTLRSSHDPLPAGASRFSAEMLLSLGALFCIVAGYFAVLPMMEGARAGAAGPSFAMLHAVAAGFFFVKVALVAILAWRLAGRRKAADDAIRVAGPTS